MANTKITSRVIADDAILTANIADDQITSALIADDVALGGNPTTSTQTAGNNTTRIATTAFVSTAVANIVNSAPATLDTLGEIATALNNDAALNTTLTNSIATKAPLASPTFTGDVDIDATDDLRLRFLNGSTFKAGIQVPTSTGDMISGAAVDDLAIRSQANMLFSTGGNTERVRIDSSGKVGIGTTSPSSYYSDNLVVSTPAEGGITLASTNTTNGNYLAFADGTSGDARYRGLVGYNHNVDSLLFYSAGAERMRIDSSGNVGIGITSPSDYYNTADDLVIGGSSNHGMTIVSGTSDNGAIFFADGTSGDAEYRGYLIYQQNDDAMRFATAATERMRIASNGKVGIGETDPTAYYADNLVVKAPSEGGITIGASANSHMNYLMFAESATSGAGGYRGYMGYAHSSTATNGRLVISSQGRIEFNAGSTERLRITATGNISHTTTGTGNGYMNFTNNDAGGVVGYIGTGKSLVSGAGNDEIALRGEAGVLFSVSSNEKMRINSSGNVGIGVTNPDGELHVESAGNADVYVERTSGAKIHLQAQSALGNIGTNSNHDLGLMTNGSVRARVHNDGGISIGTADKLDASCLLAFGTHTNDNVGIVSIRSQGDDESACALSVVKAANSTSTSQIYIKFGVNAYNSGGGMITASGATGAFGSFSDVRLKENISDLPSQLSNILALRPVNFDYKDSFHGGKDQIGFIAQEVETVYSDLVGENDGYKITSGLNKMEARLIKAIQEQQEQIETLKKEVEELKGG